jgi:uncharacterized protein YcaQ
MKARIHEVSKEDLKRIAIVGTHLHTWQGKGDDGIRDVFQQQATVQLDPLNPAGRNHDLFFLSRIPDYGVNRFQELIYPNKLVFESYFPNLMAIYKDHYPIFAPQMKKEYLHKYFQSRFEKMEKLHSGILDEARSFLADKGPSTASELGELASVKPEFDFWKTSNLAGMALEMLWLLGKAAICSRDEHWRKKYDLIENYLDNTLLKESSLTDAEISYQKFLIRQKSYPLINLGKVSTKSESLTFGKRKRLSTEWFEKKDDENCPEILISEENQNGFGVPFNWEEFLDVEYDDEMRSIAPLDPLIWDRDLTNKIFSFNYAWEVYKIPKDRIWGYYVYPLLYQDNLVGRLEVKFDKQKKELSVFNLLWEENFKVTEEAKDAYYRLFARWKNMLSAENLKFDNKSLI